MNGSNFLVTKYQEQHRDHLLEMLASGSDPFSTTNLGTLYVRDHPSLLAWSEGTVVGLLHRTGDLDCKERPAFRQFDLPPGSHQIIIRLYVQPSLRGLGIGSALLESYVFEARREGITFIGGYLDETSDSTLRRRFFERAGFTVDSYNTFGSSVANIRVVGRADF